MKPDDTEENVRNSEPEKFQIPCHGYMPCPVQKENGDGDGN